MRRAVLFAGAGLIVLAACSPDQAPTAPIKITPTNPSLELTVPGDGFPGNPPVQVEYMKDIPRGFGHGKGGHGGGGGGGSGPNLLWHGGPVMTSGAVVQPIFWGAGWNNSTLTGDKITGLQSFYGGFGGSTYANTNTEYTDGSTLHVSPAVSLGGTVRDYAGPSSEPSSLAVLAEVCSHITNPPPNGSGYYPVYVDLPRGNAGYCAWHSASSCGGTPVQFAFFFRLDGDGGCNPGSTVQNQSQGLAALANVSGHELSEALTDPRLNAWFDQVGAENADKCAWTFGAPSVLFSNGTSWKIQGNWSNNAYNTQTGYDSLRGCIQTK
jgi:hypothetical protein